MWCGPILADAVVFDTTCRINAIAAAGKNLAAQVPASNLLPNIMTLIDEYVEATFTTGIDAWGPGIPYQRPYSLTEIISLAGLRSGKKRKQYEDGVKDLLERGLQADKWRLQGITKLEPLECGKGVRLVNNPPTSDVVAGRTSSAAMDDYAHTRASIKGRDRKKKAELFAEVHTLLGDCYLVGVDDTARDANTVEHDFACYAKVLERLGARTQYTDVLLKRQGFLTRAKGVMFKGTWKSLLSGVDFTSIMNVNTTWFLAWYLCKLWGLPREAWVVIGEGDDMVIAIAASHFGMVPSLSTDYLSTVGLGLRKVLKLEGISTSWAGPGIDFVGGSFIYDGGVWWNFPKPKRMFLKATIACGRDITSTKVANARLKARALAMADRFSGIPIGWAIAASIERHASRVRGRVLFTREEEFSFQGVANQPPSCGSREAYSRCFGISVATQLTLEHIILNAGVGEDLRSVVKALVDDTHLPAAREDCYFSPTWKV
jgi:hypothetical protein